MICDPHPLSTRTPLAIVCQCLSHTDPFSDQGPHTIQRGLKGGGLCPFYQGLTPLRPDGSFLDHSKDQDERGVIQTDGRP